jgi:acyl-coenzyme A thioesterase 9
MKARKKVQASMALSKSPPTPEERLVIHDLWLESNKYTDLILPPSAVWMHSTKYQSMHITHPQARNYL